MTPFTASGVRISIPSVTPTQARAKAKSSSSPTAPAQLSTPPCGEKPTSSPTAHITATASAPRRRSVSVRPVITADCAMGSDRNRSIMPFSRSLASSTLE